MRARTLSLLAVAVAAAACARGPKKAPVAQRPNWMFDVPYLAQSVLLDTTGTPDAQHIVINSPAPIDSVTSYYRHRLPPMGWVVLGDTHDSAQATLYLERSGMPMWIQIQAQGPRSLVSFTAAGRSPGAAGAAGAPAPRAAPH